MNLSQESCSPYTCLYHHRDLSKPNLRPHKSCTRIWTTCLSPLWFSPFITARNWFHLSHTWSYCFRFPSTVWPHLCAHPNIYDTSKYCFSSKGMVKLTRSSSNIAQTLCYWDPLQSGNAYNFGTVGDQCQIRRRSGFCLCRNSSCWRTHWSRL